MTLRQSAEDGGDPSSVDLSDEQQERIRVAFDRLRSLSLYELLEVSRDADKKTIKRAFNERIMKFHPDRHFGKRLGDYKTKMEAIVVRLTEAHDVLCHPEQRALYDAALRSNRTSFIDAMLEESAAEMADLGEDARREVVILEESVTVRGSEEPPPFSGSQAKAPAQAPAPPPPPPPSTRVRTVAMAPPAGSIPAPVVRPASNTAPSVAELQTIGRELRSLHERRRGAPLNPTDSARYDLLRTELSQGLLATQRLALTDGQAPRTSLRAPVSVKLTIAVDGATHEGLTQDLSERGVGALVGSSIEPGTRCAITIHLGREAVRGTGKVVSTTPPRRGSSLHRLSLAFEPLDTKSASRLEAVVLESTLATLKA
jgi:curved DNA-binding protein CbpA